MKHINSAIGFFTCLLLTLTTVAYGQSLVSASKEVWQSQAQFQHSKAVVHWYAIEHAQDKAYWDNVQVSNLIICLNSGKTIQDIAPLIQHYGLQASDNKSKYPELINFYVFSVPNSSKEKIIQIAIDAKENGSVLYAEPEAIIESQTCYSNDPFNFPNKGWEQWGNHALWIDSAWCIAYKGGWGQWVGVIDNALDYTHPDIGVVYENDFADGDGDVKPDWTGKQTHGTHVTGIIGAKTNNGIGIAGVCNDTVFFIKAVKDGDSLFSNTAIINAIYEMARYPQLKVINMSWGSVVPSASIEAACDYAWSKNKLLIAASGNNGKEETLYPANYSSVMAVGSVGYDIATNSVVFSSSFSDYGSKQEITAAGGNNDGGDYDIYSTLPDGKYGRMAGTSMAAPMVAGVAALMFDVNPSLSNKDARTLLQQNVFDQGIAGWDKYYGYGIVCGWCAVNAAKGFKTPVTPPATGLSNTYSAEQDMTATAFPNPNNGAFTIKVSGAKATSVSVFNALGQNVWNTKVNKGDGNISADLSGLSSGMYYARVRSGLFEKVLSLAVVK